MKTLSALVLFLIFAAPLSAQEKAKERRHQSVRQLKVTKSIESPKATPPETPKVMTASGVVRTASCGTYVEVEINGVMKRFFVVNLNREMSVDGYTMKFDYVADERAFPEGCGISQSIRVNNVRKL